MRGASFGPMAAISRHGQGGRIYNNTRARVLLRRMCVKPANRTTHSPPKICSHPAQRRALPEHFLTPFPRTSAPPHSDDARPPTSPSIPHQRLPLAPAQRHALPEHFRSPHAVPTHARRLLDAFPADLTTHYPQRHAASPSVPLRAQKNGTAQCMCDAECLGRPSLRSVIWVGEPRAVRRRCGALACRRGA